MILSRQRPIIIFDTQNELALDVQHERSKISAKFEIIDLRMKKMINHTEQSNLNHSHSEE